LGLLFHLTTVTDPLIFPQSRHDGVSRNSEADEGSVAGKVAEFFCRGYSPKKVPPLPSSPPDLNLHRPEPAPDNLTSREASCGSPHPQLFFCAHFEFAVDGLDVLRCLRHSTGDRARG